MKRKYPENRDPARRLASRKAYYERSKARWIIIQREKRRKMAGWKNNSIPQDVLDRIEKIYDRNL